jgi:hypothetical protein
MPEACLRLGLALAQRHESEDGPSSISAAYAKRETCSKVPVNPKVSGSRPGRRKSICQVNMRSGQIRDAGDLLLTKLKTTIPHTTKLHK